MEEAGVLMIPLPPYYAELNPTEYVFNTPTERMRSTLARSDSFFDSALFKHEITCELKKFTHYCDVAKFFCHCGYKQF